jgi:uncharacterized protein (DUF362 family)
MRKVSKVEVESDLKSAIVEAVDGVGGFGKFIKTGDVVFLKPNFNTADPFPASSDLKFLENVSDYIYEAGAKLVMIGESSTVTLNSRKVMEKIGVFALQEKKRPPRIYVLEEEKWVKREIPNAKYLKSVQIAEIVSRADKLIFLPCLKTHAYAQFTGSLKLTMGLMKPHQRFPMHMRNLQEKFAELNTLFDPDLVIMDARKCFINRGPSEGDVEEPNLIMASTDRVAIDVEGIKIIQGYQGNSLVGIDPWELPQIKRAIELGLSKK